MPYIESNHTRYFVFENLRQAGLPHGIFTRRGGVSPAPWGTLNTGSLVGDGADRVLENLRRAANALGRDPDRLATVRQVHGNLVHRIDRPQPPNVFRKQLETFAEGGKTPIPSPETFPEADALITQEPSATLFMRFADCVPILLFDPVRRAAGIAHAGWRGTVSKVAGEAVRAMERAFGSAAKDLKAGIGPSICAEHYEVGEEVAEAVLAAFGAQADRVLQRVNGRRRFDLWEANRLDLEDAGVRQIEVAGECTFSRSDLWYSHRGEKGRTGRFVAMLGIDNG